MPRTQRQGDSRVDGQTAFGWFLMLALVLVGGAGLFGSGPLSAVAGRGDGGDGLIIYDRFVRRDATAMLTIEWAAPKDTKVVRLWVDEDYVDAIEWERMDPSASSEASASGRLLYAFPHAEAGVFTARLRFRPHTVGPLEGRLGVIDGPTFSFGQFVYP